MSWWEILAVFVGIPIGVSVAIGALVYWTTDTRVPDGIAAAARERDDSSPASPEDKAPEANNEHETDDADHDT